MKKTRYTIAVSGGRTSLGGTYKKGDEIIYSLRRSGGNFVILKSEIEDLFAKGPEPWFSADEQMRIDEFRNGRSIKSATVKAVRKLVLKGLRKRSEFVSMSMSHNMTFMLEWRKTKGSRPFCIMHFSIKNESVEVIDTNKNSADNNLIGVFDLCDPNFKLNACAILDKYVDNVLAQCQPTVNNFYGLKHLNSIIWP